MVFIYIQPYPQPYLVLVIDNILIYYNKVFRDYKDRYTNTTIYYIYRKFNAFIMLLVLNPNIFPPIY